MAISESESKLVRIHSDAPAKKEVRFGFDSYANTLAGLMANKKNETPLVIGIYGHWGSGKTTLMRAIQERLSGPKQLGELAKRLDTSPKEFRSCKTVWFQAWKYEKESEILAGLLESIFQAMAADDFFSKAKGEIEKLAKGLNKDKILGFVSKLVTGADVSDFFRELEYKKELGFYDTFRTFFDDLIWTYTNWRPKINQAEETGDTQGALVIFIDDLDRCPKPRIVKVLETVKLFMDHKGCVFVIGAARDIIVKALAIDYGEQDAHRFMEKIVQVTFSLPKVTDTMFQPLLEDLGEAHQEIFQNLSLIMPAMGYNPRQLKRFVNNLNLRHGLMRQSGLNIAFDSVLHWGIIEHAFTGMAEDFKDNPNNLVTLKKHLEDLEAEEGHSKVWKADESVLKKLKVGQSQHQYIYNKPLVKILQSFVIEKEAFLQLLTFSASVEPGEAIEVAGEEIRKASPDEDEMVTIAAGQFLYGDDKKTENIDTDFKIDIYPVTNRRFAEFINDKGYEKDNYWSEGGKKWRAQNEISRPKFWEDEKWNQPNHPVVGVSYYEAEAFAKWSGGALPTEVQWERAARGKDGCKYPWGEGFDQEKCNTQESGIGKTTRVTRYPSGISLEGCYDMAGNVYEWTPSKYDEDTMVLRGGSWNFDRDNARCAYRIRVNPNNRGSYVGFRCVRT